MTFYIYNHNQSWVGADNANGRVRAKLWLSADIQKRSVGHKMQSYLLGFFYRYAFFIVCNEEAGVLLCTWFIRRRNKCLCFSQRLFAFPSLIKNGEAFAGVSVPTQSPSPSAGAGSGPCPFPRSRQRAVGSERAALRHPRQDTRGPCGALRFLPSFRGFPLAHCSAFPFWASRLHPAPKAQGSSDGKAQPALPRPCHVDNPRKRHGPGGSRRGRGAVPGHARGASRDSWDTGTTPLTAQPRNYNSQQALRAGPAAAWMSGAPGLLGLVV